MCVRIIYVCYYYLLSPYYPNQSISSHPIHPSYPSIHSFILLNLICRTVDDKQRECETHEAST